MIIVPPDADNVTHIGIRKRESGERSLKVVEQFDREGCKHLIYGNTYIVDEVKGTVECGKCGEVVSPMWVLLQLGKQESYWMRNREDLIAIQKKLEARSRTKCQHCDKMTRIRV